VNKRARLLLPLVSVAVALLVIVAGWAAISGAASSAQPASSASGSNPAGQASPPASSTKVYRMDTDHVTYGSATAVYAASDVSVIGMVMGRSIDPGKSPGTSVNGSPVPAIPETVYSIKVDKSLKGSYSLVGRTIPVRITGGTTAAGTFQLEGGPTLVNGSRYAFFLKAGEDGAYYPLAGGAAVGSPTDSGFSLSSEVTGTQGLTFASGDLLRTMTIRLSSVQVRTRRGHDAAVWVRGSYTLGNDGAFTCGQDVDLAVGSPPVTLHVSGAKFTQRNGLCVALRASRHSDDQIVAAISLRTKQFAFARWGTTTTAGWTNPVPVAIRLGSNEGQTSVNLRRRGSRLVYP
jgi:hypothetical protein